MTNPTDSPKTPTKSSFRTTEPVSELVRTTQIEVTREKLRDRKKREIKRFRSKLP